MPWSEPFSMSDPKVRKQLAACSAARKAEAHKAYTWHDVSRDLALSTMLSLPEADEIVQIFESTGIHPQDALPYLRSTFGSFGVGRPPRPRDVALSIACLIEMGKELRS